MHVTKEILKAYTRNGLVFIKSSQEDKPLLINDIKQITAINFKNNVVANNDLTDSATHNKRKPSCIPKIIETTKKIKKHRRTSTQISNASLSLASEQSDNCFSDLSDTLLPQTKKAGCKTSVGPIDQIFTKMN